MSDPRLWNGTAWERPSFWTGSEWKSYLPAEYDQWLSWGFSSQSDKPPGWYSYGPSNGIKSGYAYSENEPGLLSEASLGVAWGQGESIDVEKYVGHQIRAEARIRWQVIVPSGSTNPERSFRFQAAMSEWGTHTLDQDRNTDVDWGWVTVQTPAAELLPRGYASLRTWSLVFRQNTADLAGSHRGQLQVDWVRWFSVTEGAVMGSIGTPGWEPLVFTAGGQWI